MAVGAVLTASPGWSTHSLGRLGGWENMRSGLEQVSCSYASASQPRILVPGVPFGSLRGGVGGLTRSRRCRDKFVVFVAVDESNDTNAGGSPSSSEGDVEALESRLGLGRRARREGGEPKPRPPPPPAPKREKKWEEMSLAEQAWSLYIGEKGFLFWLNKLAYAAIFLVIGGWIVFRFIGPALGWYELDSPLVAPDQLL